jgi:Zn-dependent protease with chaperone function
VITPALKGLALGLVFFLATNLLAAGAVAAFWRFAPKPEATLPAGARKRAAFALRLFPTVASLLTALVLFLPAWLAHEPAASEETVTPRLLGLATIAFLLGGSGLGRSLAAWRQTRALERSWAQGAQPVVVGGVSAYRIAHPFPVVAVVGLIRPRLYVAEQVLAALSPQEWAAVALHEDGHARSRDNLRHLLLRACADPLAFSSVGSGLLRAWTEAAEEEADEQASRRGPRVGLHLADALLKVAGLVPSERSALVPTLALHDGSDLARRIERLLEGEPPSSDPPRRTAWVAAGALLAAVLPFYSPLLRVVHALTERLLAALS